MSADLSWFQQVFSFRHLFEVSFVEYVPHDLPPQREYLVDVIYQRHAAVSFKAQVFLEGLTIHTQ
jgi:hypothetical protein